MLHCKGCLEAPWSITSFRQFTKLSLASHMIISHLGTTGASYIVKSVSCKDYLMQSRCQ